MDIYAAAMLIFPFMFLYAAAINVFNSYIDKKNKQKNIQDDKSQCDKINIENNFL